MTPNADYSRPKNIGSFRPFRHFDKYSTLVKMRKNYLCYYFAVAFAFAVVCTTAHILDFHVEDELNGFVNSFHSRKVCFCSSVISGLCGRVWRYRRSVRNWSIE